MSLRSSYSERPSCLSKISCLVMLLLFNALGSRICWSSTVPSSNLVFIFDASGSMGAQIQGKMKIDIAKEAITALIRDLPAGVNVGLVAYGHRQKGDCNDVEELAALGPLDKESLIKKIKSLEHKGKTPITRSVQKVAEGLKTLEDETTIVLISDGEETCDGDSCEISRYKNRGREDRRKGCGILMDSCSVSLDACHYRGKENGCCGVGEKRLKRAGEKQRSSATERESA